jgi:hypothetical protein
MGGPRRTPREAVDAAEEAIDVMRLIWSGERGVRYEGRHYGLAGVHTGPRPAHPIGIWMGAGRPRMLDLIGRKADGWVPSASWAPPEELPPLMKLIDEAASAAARDPGSIRRVYNVGGKIDPLGTKRFGRSAAAWVDELTQLALEVGMDTFIFWPEEDPLGQLEAFASEVVPEVRNRTG